MGKSVQIDDIWSKRVLDSIKGLEYGSVLIIVLTGGSCRSNGRSAGALIRRKLGSGTQRSKKQLKFG